MVDLCPDRLRGMGRRPPGSAPVYAAGQAVRPRCRPRPAPARARRRAGARRAAPGETIGAARGDIRSRMLDAHARRAAAARRSRTARRPAGRRPPALGHARRADQGPAGRAGRHRDGDLQLRPLPDRWLVVPARARPPRPARPTESVDRRVGARPAMPLPTGIRGSRATAGTALGRSARAVHRGGGRRPRAGPAIYDNVVDRLAFHDDLADLPAAAAPLTTSWSVGTPTPTLDPLHPPTDPSSFTALLDDLGWDADLSSLPEIEDRRSRSPTCTWRRSPAHRGRRLARPRDRSAHRRRRWPPRRPVRRAIGRRSAQARPRPRHRRPRARRRRSRWP